MRLIVLNRSIQWFTQALRNHYAAFWRRCFPYSDLLEMGDKALCWPAVV
jgi:hypothetical protein